MTIACREFRAELPERSESARGLDAWSPRDGEHAASCADCAAWSKRWRTRVEALVSLERGCVPAELDGLVGAALHAGHRQSRALDALQRLPRVPLPADLEGAVRTEAEQGEPAARPARFSAPSVLERLVREELADPSKARTRRFLSSLTRLRAPDALQARVAHDRKLPTQVAVRRPRAVVWGALAAGVLAAVLLPRLLRPLLLQSQPEQPRLHFQVVRSDRLELDPMSRSLVDGVSGGILSVGNP